VRNEGLYAPSVLVLPVPRKEKNDSLKHTFTPTLLIPTKHFEKIKKWKQMVV